MQAKRSSRGSNIILTRRIIIVFNLKFACCFFFRACNYSALKQNARISIKGRSYVKTDGYENVCFYILFLKPLAQRHGLFYFSFYLFFSPSGVGSRALLLGRSLFQVGALLFQRALSGYHALLNPQRKTWTQYESVLCLTYTTAGGAV